MASLNGFLAACLTHGVLLNKSWPKESFAQDKRGQGAMLLSLAEAQLAKSLAGEALSHLEKVGRAKSGWIDQRYPQEPLTLQEFSENG